MDLLSLVIFVSLLWGTEVAQAIPAAVEYRQIVTSELSFITSSASITAPPSSASALPNNVDLGSSSFSGTGTHGFNLSSYCTSRMSAFAETYIPTLTTSTRTFFEGWDAAGSNTGPVVTQSYYPTTETYSQDPYWAWSEGAATPPCCDSCILSALTVQFYYWPDQATATPASHQNSIEPSAIATTAVNSNGFTFTYPSVYIAFSTLSAKDYCGIVGTAVYNTTIALNSDEISTWPPSTTYWVSWSRTTNPSLGVLSQYVTDNATQPPVRALTYTDLGRNCSTIAGYAYFPANPSAYFNDGDPCHPIIAIPTRVQSLQKAWVDKGCSQLNAFGFYDPPQVLTPASSLEPASIPPAPARTTSVPGPTQSSHSVNIVNSESQVTYTAKTTDRPRSSPASTEDTSNIRVSAGQVESSSYEGQEPNSTTEPASSVVPQPDTTTADPASSTSILPSSTIGPKKTTYLIGGQSSAPALVVGGTTYSADSASQYISAVIVASSTYSVSPAEALQAGSLPVVTIGSAVITPIGSQYVLPNGQTISVGGATGTLDGTPIAVLTGGSGVAVGSSTLVGTNLAEAAAHSITVAGHTITANAAGAYVLSGLTLSVSGPSITAGNDVYGIQTNSVGQTELVVGGVSTRSANIASYILSALGAIESASSAHAETGLSIILTETKSSGPAISKTGVSSGSRSGSDAISTTRSADISTGDSTATNAGVTATSTTKKSDAVLEMQLGRAFVALGLACCMVVLF